MNSPQVSPRAIIFDIGDVLLKWSAKTTTSIPPRKLRDILSTLIWFNYERGGIDRDVCYEMSAQIFSPPATEIAEAFSQARESLQPDHSIVSFIRELRMNPAIRVYAMSNIGKEDFEELETKADWQLFDRLFTSASAGMRRSELGFYSHVLNCIGLAANQVTFIDDKDENVDAARTLGIRGLIFGDWTVDTLREILYSPIGKGWRWLYQNANRCDSTTTSGITFADNFAKLLIVDILQDQTLVDISWGSSKTWNFFADKDERGHFPDDLDTTSLALIALRPSTKTVSSVLNKMSEYVNDDGTFQTYFDRDKKRVDLIVSANILACFYFYDRGHEFGRTLQLTCSMLLDRSYMQGTRYYNSADCCLGFVGRLVRSSNDLHLQMTLKPLLKLRIRERVGLGGSALDLAMRIITCQHMGIACDDDRRALLDMQCNDGSWETGWMYQYGGSGVKIGNCAVTTAMAVAALSSQNIRDINAIKNQNVNDDNAL